MRVDPNYVTNLAAAVDQSSAVEQELVGQLSSGLRVSSLADDPVAVAQSALLGSAIAKDDTYVRTAGGVVSRMQVADTTLGEIVAQLTSAVSLAVQGSNGTQNAANLATVTEQLRGIRDQVLALANTSYQGQYLFGGSQGSVQPFTLDTSTIPATTTYHGDTQPQYIETPNGQKIQVNLPGSDTPGVTTTGIFPVLNQLIADLSGGAAATAISADTAALTASLGQVSNQRSILDSSLGRVQSTSVYAQTDEAQLKVQQNGLVAADTAEVATRLSSAEMQHQALLSVMSAVEKTSLFDYLR